jgi:hypothetical protein
VKAESPVSSTALEGVVTKTKLSFLLLFVAALGMSPAQAITYDVNVTGLQSQLCYPSCVTFGSLTGTITTDGTFGNSLSPSIITGWSFLLTDNIHIPVTLTTADSFITYNFSDLLSASPTELHFNFSPNPPRSPQPNLEFTSSSNGAIVATIFAETDVGVPTIDPGGIGIALGFDGTESVTYLSGTQLIGKAPETPLPAALPLFATGLGALGLLGWRRKRKNASVMSV